MAVDTIHSDHAAMADKWRRCRAAFAGQDAVHDGKEYFLPQLSEQSDADYKSYLKRTPWYAASGRTLDGLMGLIFRRDPVAEYPASFEAMYEDVGLNGRHASEFARDVMLDVLAVGRVGVLVEYPQVTDSPASLAEASQRNLRPYATIYKAEAIRNWRVQRVNNQIRPVLVVLDETWEDRIDEFESKHRPQIRALMLQDGRYIQRVYRKNDRDEWTIFDELTPTKNGVPLSEIPFFAFGPECNDLSPQIPPLLDLVDLNLSHYRSSADLEHGAHFTGLPMLFLAGIQLDKGEKIALGSQSAVVSPDPNASGQYIEFTGQGLTALETRCQKKEEQMAALGARMLAPEKSGIEAADTIAQRHNGEFSVLAGMAKLAGEGIERVLRTMADWAGIPNPESIEFELNTDYTPAGLSAQELTALVGAWQAGAISWDVLFQNLKRGDVIAGDVDMEDERERRSADAPLGGMTGGGVDGE